MVRSGLEVLLRERLDLLRGRRVGLVTHPAAVLPDLTASVDALCGAGMQLTALFGMEHGFAGSAADGKALADGVDGRTGLPVFSLYGASKEPTAEMLAGVDVLVYDVQDVGVRFYTFISTLHYLLRAAGQHDRPVIVLDRPNPINGLTVEGTLVAPGFESFVGIAPLPIRHGMTAGELALCFNDLPPAGSGPEGGSLGAGLTVVEMQGWQRDMRFDATGLPWVPTSPAMPHLSTATVYPGACLLEAVNVSEGRGTALPFEQCGAPWADAHDLAEAMNALELAGVHFRPTSFEPSGNRYAGQTCYGVQIHVTDRDALQPVRMGLHLIATLKALYPAKAAWSHYERADGSRLFHFDRLIGNAEVREALDAGTPVKQITSDWAAAEEEFRYRRRAYLLYGGADGR
jgi:uncharacterized protein YbbC (DUF1343 family)